MLAVGLTQNTSERRGKVRRYGYQGFYDKLEKPVVLTRKNVDGIQLTGGTILGTSRGGADIKCGATTAKPCKPKMLLPY